MMTIEEKYGALLRVVPHEPARVVLVDDACTRGSTLRCCALALKDDEVVGASTAGQLTVKKAMRDPTALLGKARPMMKPASLSKQRRIEILEGIIEDPAAPGYQRVQAMALLERLEAQVAKSALEVDEDLPPDPMGDLDELAPRRRRRS
jgi:hypothetical protein